MEFAKCKSYVGRLRRDVQALESKFQDSQKNLVGKISSELNGDRSYWVMQQGMQSKSICLPAIQYPSILISFKNSCDFLKYLLGYKNLPPILIMWIMSLSVSASTRPQHQL